MEFLYLKPLVLLLLLLGIFVLLPFLQLQSSKNGQGKILRFKARFVIGGHRQREGLDNIEVYAAVARYQTIRTLLAYATQSDWCQDRDRIRENSRKVKQKFLDDS